MSPVKTIWSLYEMQKFHAAVFVTAFVELELTLSKCLLEEDHTIFKDRAVSSSKCNG